MEKLADAVSAMNRLELQMTKDVDTVRRGLFDTQTEQQDPTGPIAPAADDVPLPARILQIREARRRLEVPDIASSRGPMTAETEDF
jgi:hypothetical protein